LGVAEHDNASDTILLILWEVLDDTVINGSTLAIWVDSRLAKAGKVIKAE